MSTFTALPLGLLGGSFANISGTAFRATPVNLGVVFFGYTSDFAYTQNLVLFAEHNEIVGGKVLVIRHKTVVVVGLARLVLVAINAL